MAFDTAAYLERIGLDSSDIGAVSADTFLPTLAKVVDHHRLAIPFENLASCGVFPIDPAHVHDHATERISLDGDRIFQKLVTDKRGGYCFEQNALLAAALRAFGYTVATLSARVVLPPSSDPNAPPGNRLTGLSHMMLLVRWQDDTAQYLCDVGFGGRGQPPSPLALTEENVVHTKGGETYQLKRVQFVRHANESYFSDDLVLPLAGEPSPTSSSWAVYYKTQAASDVFHASYVFSTNDVMSHADYIAPNWYVSTSPQSRFTQAATCVKRTDAGLLTLQDMSFNHIEYGQVVETKTLASASDRLDVLRVHFDLVPPQV